MAYRYGIKNGYKPAQLTPHAYGWSRGQTYNSADVPSQWVDHQSNISTDALKQQFAYEWFQSGDRSAGFTGAQGLVNPPFVSGAAGRLHPLLLGPEGGPARILRGYIRRAEYDVKDDLSKCRLYFMYNPEIITREYVSYLEQSALDPFNTVYQSGNLIAPPSILNFSFELFFDRQEEAAGDPDHPGVFVDYQFFDMVVRNVIPNDPGQANNTLPDNGVMMVNPRDITVVFSPMITVQGRPTNAQVVFEKFTHRMTPVRMRIQLQILASYFGPVRDMVEYKKEELLAEEAIPIDEYKPTVYDITFLDVDSGGAGAEDQLGQANDANHQIRLQALAWARTPEAQAKQDAVALSAQPARLITEAYVKIGQGETMGWASHPGVSTIMTSTRSQTAVFIPLEASFFDWKKDLLSGDILIGGGGIAFFVGYSGDNCTILVDPGVGDTIISGHGTYSHLLRPTPLGSLGSGAQAGSYNDRPVPNLASSGVLTQSQTVEVLTGQGNNIRLSPQAVQAWNSWRAAWGGPIPCTSGWRDGATQQANYLKNPNRFAPASSSYHCKGLAVDVNNDWLNALSAADKTRFRNAARNTGWGQARWRKKEGPQPGYEAPCNPQNGTKTDEPWHFSYGGCG